MYIKTQTQNNRRRQASPTTSLIPSVPVGLTSYKKRRWQPGPVSSDWSEVTKITGTCTNIYIYEQMEVVSHCSEQYLRCFACQQPCKRHSFSLMGWLQYYLSCIYNSMLPSLTIIKLLNLNKNTNRIFLLINYS